MTCEKASSETRRLRPEDYVARAFSAFQRGDYSAAIDSITSMLHERERISGSRAQIDLVEFTLLKAYLLTGRLEEARRLLETRLRARGIPVAGAEAALIH